MLKMQPSKLKPKHPSCLDKTKKPELSLYAAPRPPTTKVRSPKFSEVRQKTQIPGCVDSQAPTKPCQSYGNPKPFKPETLRHISPKPYKPPLSPLQSKKPVKYVQSPGFATTPMADEWPAESSSRTGDRKGTSPATHTTPKPCSSYSETVLYDCLQSWRLWWPSETRDAKVRRLHRELGM